MITSGPTTIKMSSVLREAVDANLLEILNFPMESVAKFASGSVAITPLAKQTCQNLFVIPTLLKRHFSGDFGQFGTWDDYQVSQSDLDNLHLIDDDLKLNKLAVMGHYVSVLSAYTVNNQTIWIKTENMNTDAVYTVVMLPSEH